MSLLMSQGLLDLIIKPPSSKGTQWPRQRDRPSTLPPGLCVVPSDAQKGTDSSVSSILLWKVKTLAENTIPLPSQPWDLFTRPRNISIPS